MSVKTPIDAERQRHTPVTPIEIAAKPLRLRRFLFVGALVITWVVVSPMIWWRSLYREFGIQVEFALLLQPVALAVVAVLAGPFLWKASAKAAVVLMALSVLIAMSIVLAPTVFPEGALLNAGLLCMLGFVRWRASKRLPHVAGGA